MTGLDERRYAAHIVRRLLGERSGASLADWLSDEELERRLDLDEVLRRVMDQLTRRLGADRGTLYLVDHATQELVSRVAHLPEIAEIRLRIGEGIAGRVAATARPLVIPADDELAPIARRVDGETGYETRNLLAVPVLDQGVVVAVAQLLNKRSGDFDRDDLQRMVALAERIAQLLDRTSLSGQLRPGSRQPLAFRYNHIVGDSASMQRVYELTRRAAPTEATVLVRGESGTGKELVARAMHDNSQRAKGPFVKVDCAALPETLIENELFGHERGSFTGADGARSGKVEVAQGGTLFLDEIGELSLAVQGKLLRLLQDRTYLRVGGTRPRKADLRFVCATHVDLEAAVASGAFRQDLYYRLRVVEVRLPSLRERGGGDLDRLVDHFLHRFGREHSRGQLQLSEAARAALHAHGWPGNVRELQHCIESAVVLSEGRLLRRNDLRLDAGSPQSPGSFRCDLLPLREVEVAYIEHVLQLCSGNKSEAARLLGIGRNTLLRKLKKG